MGRLSTVRRRIANVVALKRILRVALVLAVQSSAHAVTPNLSAGTVTSQLVINTRTGPVYNAVRYAPHPVLPPGLLRSAIPGHGVFAVDVGIVTGYPVDVRVLQSTGSKPVDNIVVETLRKWRFRPRSVYKAIVRLDVVLTQRTQNR
jgi:hypothetical protein